MVTFYTKETLPKRYLRQIIKIAAKSLPEINEDLTEGLTDNEIRENLYILDETLVGVVTTPKGRNVEGFVFLWLADEKKLESDEDFYKSLKDQGLTGDNDVYLYNMCIRPKSRRKGKALSLLARADMILKEKGKTKIILFVKGDNRPAVALYNRLDYRVRLATPYGFLMEKNLT